MFIKPECGDTLPCVAAYELSGPTHVDQHMREVMPMRDVAFQVDQ